MSIVKQIVDLSGGRIDIRSELGKGTEVVLSLPLEKCLPNAEDLTAKLNLYNDEGPINAVRRRAKGRTVQIRGFDATFGNSKLQEDSLASLKASIVKYVTEWFKLEIVADDQPPDIVISDESAFLKSSNVAGCKLRLLLIICSNRARRNIYNNSGLDLGQTVEFISKPCGPHRCAKAILNCLDAEDALQTANTEKRVSSDLSGFSAIASTHDAMVTASKKNASRLIGNLQSSIGLSPKNFKPKGPPAAFTGLRIPSKAHGRPPMPDTVHSGVVATVSSDSSSPANNSSSTPNDTSEGSSDNTSNGSSTAFLGQASPSLELSPQDGTNSPRKPKMLLVEVRHSSTLL
jgi:hypothetical protein